MANTVSLTNSTLAQLSLTGSHRHLLAIWTPLVRALTNDHVAYEFVTIKAETFHFALDQQAQLTRQSLDLLRTILDVFQLVAQYGLDRLAYDHRPELVPFVRRRLVRVLQFRFRFRFPHEHALATHRHHGVGDVAQRATSSQHRLRHRPAAVVARVGCLARHDRHPPAHLRHLRRPQTARVVL